ncbi:hypothetical protein Afil01_00440 [Actinorhabdospora filicis]|uniref:Transporter family-2 protein n=1 Tax=Actinorhabdospora filicis TaxID=1785913 RepID=A0A9W6SFU9_9ACTN|nr:DMT family transporter [Actinorhabdospora filicis]GLZ75237.1 hypothetical protein Afil01_00440 [Actinorhabdospora filicis]
MDTVTTPRKSTPALAAIGFAVIAGVAGAAQSAVNATLGQRVGSPLSAALISNLCGGLLLAVIITAVPEVRRGIGRIRRSPQPWWIYCGGVFGALFLFTGALTVPLIGVALFTVGQVCGQTGGGLLADRTGLGPAGRRPVTAFRVLGTLLAITAVIVAGVGRGFDGDAAWWLLPLVAVMGVGLAVQGAVNGRLTLTAGQPFATSVVNFLAGTSAILVVFIPLRLAGTIPWNGLPSEPWLYVGGLMGPFVVVCSVLAINSVGVLRAGLGVLAGQLTGALALDLARTGAAPSPWILAGVAITAGAVWVSGRTKRVVGEG